LGSGGTLPACIRLSSMNFLRQATVMALSTSVGAVSAVSSSSSARG
jgi:hypothetical protein